MNLADSQLLATSLRNFCNKSKHQTSQTKLDLEVLENLCLRIKRDEWTLLSAINVDFTLS